MLRSFVVAALCLSACHACNPGDYCMCTNDPPVCHKTKAPCSCLTPGAITNLLIKSNAESCPSGYSQVAQRGKSNGDFNQGAGGKYLYLCLQQAAQMNLTANSTNVVEFDDPITSLTVVSSGDSSDGCPGSTQDVTRIQQAGDVNGDFNEGANGKFIYLCYSRGTGSPLTDLFVTDTNDCSDFGVPRITQQGDSNGDFNQGAGGDFIYLCAKH